MDLPFRFPGGENLLFKSRGYRKTRRLGDCKLAVLNTQDLTFTQQVLLMERAQSTTSKYLSIWMVWCRSQKGMLRARMWLASRQDHRRKLNAIRLIQRYSRHGKRLNQILHAFQWRKSRSLQHTVAIQWARVARIKRAFVAAANTLLERSERALAIVILAQWQQVVDRRKMAEEHGKSAGLRRSLMAAKAAMSSFEPEDFNDLLPTLAPEVYARSVEENSEENLLRLAIINMVCAFLKLLRSLVWSFCP